MIFLSDDDVSKPPEGRRAGTSVLGGTGSCNASGILMAVLGGARSGENMDDFSSIAGLDSTFGFVGGGSCVPTGGKTMSGRVNGGGELCSLWGGAGAGCSGVTVDTGGGFSIPE